MEIIKELWRVIENYPSYQVSNLGNVRRIRDNYIVPWSYPKVPLKDGDGDYKAHNVHRLVAKAFIEKPKSEDDLIVGHKDDNKQDPRACNLKWITRSQNNHESYMNNRKRIDDGYRANCKPVIAKHYESDQIIEFGGVRLAARKLGLQNAAVKQCCKGRSSNSHGWQFMYKDEYDKLGYFPRIKKIDRYNKKPVQQLDIRTEDIINEYSSAREAAIATGTSYPKISSVCHGNRNTTGGYKWRFV